MDIYCPKCGEPWDMECLHEEIDHRWPDKPWNNPPSMTAGFTVGDMMGLTPPRSYANAYDQVRSDFRRKGCEALTAYECKCSTEPDRDAAEAMTALLEIMPDDLDGCAAMMEDFELFFR